MGRDDVRAPGGDGAGRGSMLLVVRIVGPLPLCASWRKTLGWLLPLKRRLAELDDSVGASGRDDDR